MKFHIYTTDGKLPVAVDSMKDVFKGMGYTPIEYEEDGQIVQSQTSGIVEINSLGDLLTISKRTKCELVVGVQSWLIDHKDYPYIEIYDNYRE